MVESNFPSSSHRIMFCFSSLPLIHQLSQQELYDTTIRRSHCAFLIACIVYLFFFSDERRKQGRHRREKTMGEAEGLIIAQGIAVSLFVSLNSLISKSHRLALADTTPFLLAGQALYYSDMPTHVCQKNCAQTYEISCNCAKGTISPYWS